MTPANPIQELRQQLQMRALARGGQDAMPQQQAAQARQALTATKPAEIVAQLRGIKQAALPLISATGMTIPGVARALAAALKGLDAAIKEAESAAQTEQATQQRQQAQTPAALSGMPASSMVA